MRANGNITLEVTGDINKLDDAFGHFAKQGLFPIKLGKLKLMGVVEQVSEIYNYDDKIKEGTIEVIIKLD